MNLQTIIPIWIEFHSIIEILKDFYPETTQLSVIKRLLKNAERWDNAIRESLNSTKEGL